ncbi:MAG: FtsX-like permease family protein [Lentisphaerae bacterium]|nr:FtsX-like permease family protein [Lentisphaerota bacterium]MBQ9804533.1 ABC transporter permease [Lentisphaeria bacterium]
MNTFDTIIMALVSLKRNPTRTMLTMLGIIIGIGAVITMMEIGAGSSTAIRTTIERMGAGSGIIYPGVRRVAGIKGGTNSWASLLPADAEAILRECPSVALVSPVVRSSTAQAIFGSENWIPNQMYGVAPSFFAIRDWEIAEGRAFTEAEVNRNSRVCVVGSTVVKELFGGISPLDCEMRINNSTFRVIGILKSKGANMMGTDEDDIILIPWTTMRMRITGLRSGSPTSTTSTLSTRPGDRYPVSGVAFYPEQDSSMTSDKLVIPKFTYIDQIAFAASSPAKIDQAQQEIAALLRERHKLVAAQDDDFRIRSASDFMKMMNKTSTLMNNLLLGVALLSLVVGGVGIMNIMLVSVTERTREIGLRMAVGARSRDILKQFLIESVVMCLLGGIIGIFCGHGTALLIEAHLHWPIESSPGAVVAAFAVSASIGIIFGFYPAWKASQLDPIEALRYE